MNVNINMLISIHKGEKAEDSVERSQLKFHRAWRRCIILSVHRYLYILLEEIQEEQVRSILGNISIQSNI
jgi:hypothetical protein